MERVQGRPGQIAVVAALALFGYTLIRTAWLSDDAYITFRTIDNVLNGDGLRWNVIERVQTYTHPLWMMLLTAVTAMTRDFYLTPIFLAIAGSMAAVTLVAFGHAANRLAAVLGVAVLLFSRAFVDYSTSGLENPLTYLLLAGFLALFFRSPHSSRTVLGLSLIAALGMLNRLDSILLFGPALLVVVWQQRSRQSLKYALLGLTPLVLWELFSLVYYGFPLPNTAYAKLFTATPREELLRQGLFYFHNSWSLDGLTLPAIALGMWLAVRTKKARELAVAAGLALHLAYTVWIGGDFMSGRFLAAPLLISVILIVRTRVSVRGFAFGLGVTIAVGFASPFTPITAGSDFGQTLSRELDDHGIADERQFYYQATGLLSASRTSSTPAHRYVRDAMIARRGPDVRVMDTMGMHGFFVGRDVHVIDMFGLCDPLTARLPARRDVKWRPGHFLRVVPDGYEASVRLARSGILDEPLAEFDTKLRLITRGPLFGAERWKAIVEMNLGRSDALIDRRRYRFPEPQTPQ